MMTTLETLKKVIKTSILPYEKFFLTYTEVPYEDGNLKEREFEEKLTEMLGNEYHIHVYREDKNFNIIEYGIDITNLLKDIQKTFIIFEISPFKKAYLFTNPDGYTHRIATRTEDFLVGLIAIKLKIPSLYEYEYDKERKYLEVYYPSLDDVRKYDRLLGHWVDVGIETDIYKEVLNLEVQVRNFRTLYHVKIPVREVAKFFEYFITHVGQHTPPNS